MIYTSPIFIKIRSITRKIGFNRLFRYLFRDNDYEDNFGPVIVSEIQSGDCVWDVGANVGLYTVKFAERICDKGKVIAFEPVPACYERLLEQTKKYETVSAVNVAMGSEDGNVTMLFDDEVLAATHRVVCNGPYNARISDGCNVVLRSATSIVQENPEWFPNVIKIDVEGYEGAVFDGLKDLLSNHSLRCIGIEVHFGLLEERGETYLPLHIERSLEQNGFNVNWPDPSHLIAIR